MSVEGTYLICHAYKSLLTPVDESGEVFTLQANVSLPVTVAIEDVTPTALLINELITLNVPGGFGVGCGV